MNSDEFSKARKLEDRGEFALAAEEYKRAIELRSGNQADAHQRRGRALARLGRYEEALNECQKALALDPDLPLAHGVLGDIYLQQARYDLAEEKYLTSLSLKPNNVAAIGNLAYIYSRQGDYDKAITMYERGLQYHPHDPKLRVGLAEMYRCQFRFREAMAQLNNALKARFSFWLLFRAVVILVNAVLQYSGKLNPIIRTGISALIYGVALFAPPFLSVPVGLVGLGFGLVLVFVYPRIYTYEGKELKVFSLFLLYFLSCAIYWATVLVRPRLIEWWLSLD